ncbi:hypothetical protein CTEN210_09358 [Chaetoceros tenuissimus]|uniref:Uncharacterized protein n=1 Tax=Chaetoceros tenuissimus TaxID=426638 RepID=A0AAD3CVM9_9STRA|nr:hypothetical protein CTEN210_09358 [Chaetoceros tenuissimus]
MKFYSFIAPFLFSQLQLSQSFSITPGRCLVSQNTYSNHQHGAVSHSSTRLQMESDFASAMPEKPKLTFEEQMYESATTFIVDLEGRLGEGVSPPKELEELRQARDAKAPASEIAAKIYILLIEQGMTYDQDPDDGRLTPTSFNIKEGLDIPEVKQEFAYLYKYGMSLIAKGVVEVDTVKDIVKERLIERTGLSPEEFDKWLGY